METMQVNNAISYSQLKFYSVRFGCSKMEFLGVRVVRGPDWEWSNQDGGEGSVGTVVQIGSDTKSAITEPIVLVQWDCGRKATYRAGMDGKYDLRILDNANRGNFPRFCSLEQQISAHWHSSVATMSHDAILFNLHPL